MTIPRVVIYMENDEVTKIYSDIDINVEVITKVDDDIHRELLKDSVNGEFIGLDSSDKKSHFVFGNPVEVITAPSSLTTMWVAAMGAFK